MEYIKFLFFKIKRVFPKFLGIALPILIFVFIIYLAIASEEEISLDPNDYCKLTDVDYTAILHDDPNGKANVEITEYLTFDVHAASKSNTFKELWRELPEDTVDGLKVTYDVKSVTQILDNGKEIPYSETKMMYWEDEDYNQYSTYRWHHSKASGRYPDNDESLLIYIPWTYREKMVFKIVYSMNNAALKYKDCSELYLSMYSGNTIKDLNSYKAQILIPSSIMPSTYHAYTFGTSNSRIPFTESDSVNPGYHTFAISLDKKDLKFDFHNRYIEFCLLAYGEDKHIFTRYAPNNKYTRENVLDECIAENEYYESQNMIFKSVKNVLLVSSIVVSLLIVILTIMKYIKARRKNTLYKPEVKYDYFREIPSDLDPMFASELVFMNDPYNENKEKKEEYAAILLSLVRKQYVKISKINEAIDWSDTNTLISLEPINTEYQTPDVSDESIENLAEPICIVKNANTNIILEPLSTSERLYYELLERYAKTSNNTITLSQFQRSINSDYTYTNLFVKDIEKKPAIENGVMNGYFQDVNYDSVYKKFMNSAKVSLIFGWIILILANGISYFTPLGFAFGAYTILAITCFWRYMYLSVKAKNVIAYTQYGVNEQAKWCGLYNFLNSDTLLKERTAGELPLWEKYLIYATAFGISEKVVKAIKIHAIDLKIDNSPILNNHCYIHSSSFHRTSRSFGHSIHTSSRGGFSGHGYGGGGRGGGGGGGGH